MSKYSCHYLAALISFSLITAAGPAVGDEAGQGHTGSIGTSPIEREVNAELPTLVFYKLPHCGICTMIDQWLVELDREHEGVANYVRKNSTDTTLHPEMNGRGIKHHGVVILDTEGEVKWAGQAHGLQKEVLATAFAQHVVKKK